MSEQAHSEERPTFNPALGHIEPHAPLLRMPPVGQLLYKIFSVENLLRSISGSYLHFNRVDRYRDFEGADLHDGQQLPRDLDHNQRATFERAPTFSLAHYYDQSRARTYACCFSLENSEFIWRNYAKDSARGKVAVVFDLEKLRAMLNQTVPPSVAALDYRGVRCNQIFSINYGVVRYVDWHNHQDESGRLPNPIQYSYLKDASTFSGEREFRITLAALGIGNFALNDGTLLEFPDSLQLDFDFRSALSAGVIERILCEPDSDIAPFLADLEALHIKSVPA